MHPLGSAAAQGPEVICLAHFDRLPNTAVTFSRRNVAKRDHSSASTAERQPGADSITIDHVLPRSQGGASNWTNCAAACLECNTRKGDRTPEQAGMRLRRRPVRPEWKPFYAARRCADRELVSLLEARAGPGHWPEPADIACNASTGVCSWESSEPPKLADRVQILAPLLTIPAF